MRDFRNAKVMSQTLRSALAAKGIKITVGQSLELVAAMFGLADWNTLAAAINAEKPVPREKVSPLSDMRSNPFSTAFRRARYDATSGDRLRRPAKS